MALRLTPKVTFAPGTVLRSALTLVVIGTGFILVSMGEEWILADVTGVGAPGATAHQLFAANLLGFLMCIAISQAAYYFTLSSSGQFRTSELEAKLTKSRLQMLETQLQPHFLLNTLNTVAELVHTEPDGADQMITGLGRLLRLSLDNAGHRVMRLRDECDFLRLYIEIEQVRFGNGLEVTWDLAPETLDAAVPTLLWHPVLENAILHGLIPLGRTGCIAIQSRREKEDLILEIRDNGRGLPAAGDQREGVGLRNIRERIAQLYGSRARFSLERAAGRGTIAALRLPFTLYEESREVAGEESTRLPEEEQA